MSTSTPCPFLVALGVTDARPQAVLRNGQIPRGRAQCSERCRPPAKQTNKRTRSRRPGRLARPMKPSSQVASSFLISTEVSTAAGRMGRLCVRKMPRITAAMNRVGDRPQHPGPAVTESDRRPKAIRCARENPAGRRDRRRRSRVQPAERAPCGYRTNRGRPAIERVWPS